MSRRSDPDPIRSLPVDHEAFLAELSTKHGTVAVRQAEHWLRVRGPSFSHRWQRAWIEPLLFTLQGRRNFFRAAFCHTVGEMVGEPQVGAVTAVVGEIMWTCSLVADDIIDGSTEREGHVAAHVRFGTFRAAISILIGVCTASSGLLLCSPTSIASRLRMVRLLALLMLRCAWSQVPFRRAPRDLAALAALGRDVNSLTHWALLAPVAGSRDRRLLKPLRASADAISVNAKMRNDLLDYCGGSTENTTRYRDFETRRVTFPIVVLLQQPPSDADRVRIRGHFLHRSLEHDLTISDLFGMFQTYGTFDQCLALMRRQAELTHRAIEEIERNATEPSSVCSLLRRWVWHQMDLTEQRVAAGGIHARAAGSV